MFSGVTSRGSTPSFQSSTPSFYDRGLSVSSQVKPLPSVPEESPILPPPPLQQRRFMVGNVKPDSARKTKRLTWSEEQVEILERQVKDLRRAIFHERRQGAEKDRHIARLEARLNKHLQIFNEQDDQLKQFADTLDVALDDLRLKRKWSSPRTSSEESADTGSSYLDELITVYNRI
ncbi:hypothetical protein GQ53DRAFT_824981 [Thozetella sp. PMI_491]|nr:hypothetical protein GQ53DRAFT_824981 [Thozetella sp. PMI_491]